MTSEPKIGSFILTEDHARLLEKAFLLAESDPRNPLFYGLVMPAGSALQRHIRLWKSHKERLSRRGDRGVAAPVIPCKYCREPMVHDQWGLLLHESVDAVAACQTIRGRTR